MNEIVRRFTNKANPVIVKYSLMDDNPKLWRQRAKIYNKIFIQNGYKIMKEDTNSVSLIREIKK
jgi:hypothetical protein